MTIEFDPKNRSKIFQKSVRVQTNGEPKEVVLRIKGFIVPDPTVLRKNFGNLRMNRAEFSFTTIYDTETKRDSIVVGNIGESEIDLVFEKEENEEMLEITIRDNPILVGETTYIYAELRGDKDGEYGFNRKRVKFYDRNNPEKTMGILLISYSQAEDFKAWTNEERSHAPQVKFRQTTVDFGNRRNDEEVECEFTFSNPGQSDLIIRNIETASFVNVISYDEKVSPGEEGKIILGVNLQRSVGEFKRNIKITTNCPTREKNNLTIKGKVIDR